MVRPFPAPEFLLCSGRATELYQQHARDLPIIDYHCHLDPAAIAENVDHHEIVDLWIAGDPYKWRAMRQNGVPERVITGDASPEQRFRAWAGTLPHLVGNPLYHWSAMELQRYFGISEPLCEANADRIRRACNQQLQTGGFRTQDLLARCRVQQVCTSDDWTDSLQHHRSLSQADAPVVMRPSLRADRALAVDSPDYVDWVQRVGELSGTAIGDLGTLKRALGLLLDRFAAAGCRMADHGLPDASYVATDESQAASLFADVWQRRSLSPEQTLRLRSALLSYLAGQYARRGWVMQLHLGAHRATSTRLHRLCGPAGGFACIGSSLRVESLCRWFDDLEQQNSLPRTILYPLNPADLEMLASLTGSFVQAGVAGKIQLGPARWYNDHADGIRRQLRAVAAHSLLGRFVGMTTDSRSVLSMVRHDYFRRLLCDLIADWVGEGSVPDDDVLLGTLIRNVCYENARTVHHE
jgi:glucuronate isomerase